MALRAKLIAGACAVAVFAGGVAIGALASGEAGDSATTSPQPPDTRELAELLTGTTSIPELANLPAGAILPNLKKAPGSTPSTPPTSTSVGTTTAPPPTTTAPTPTTTVCC